MRRTSVRRHIRRTSSGPTAVVRHERTVPATHGKREFPKETYMGDSCFKCGKEQPIGAMMWRWYHGDQDDMICSSCAGKLKHTDTAYYGMNVKTSVEPESSKRNKIKNVYCDYCKKITPHGVYDGKLVCRVCASSRMDKIQGMDAALM